MFSILDGRTEFYQWDKNQFLIIDDPAIEVVHFCNRLDNCSLVCHAFTQDGKNIVEVPNILLQTNYQIHVYAFQADSTRVEEIFEVNRRTKPDDYVYTPTETICLDKLATDIGNLAELITDDKSNLVAALNEVAQNGGGGTYNQKQADWLQEDNTKVDFIKNKPAIPAKTSDLTNDSGFITEEAIPDVPTKTSQLTNDSNFITEEAIPTKTSDLTNDSGFITSEAVPTKTSDLTNDSNFATTSYVDEAVAGAGGMSEEDKAKLDKFGNGYVIAGQDPRYTIGERATAEGAVTNASGYAAHAEGTGSKASGYASHSEGGASVASGQYSHAEGASIASGDYSHAEGAASLAEGNYSHAEGYDTEALSEASHAEGRGTIINSTFVGAHVQGKYNINYTNLIHIIGNGTGPEDANRSNIHTIDKDGEAWFQGDVYVGSRSGKNYDSGSKKLATEEYVNNAVAGGGGGGAAQVQADWNQTDDTQVDFIKNKPTIPTVPTNISAFTNDAGYQTEAQVQALIQAALPPSGEEVSY